MSFHEIFPLLPNYFHVGATDTCNSRRRRTKYGHGATVVLWATFVCACAQTLANPDSRFVMMTAQANMAQVLMSAWARDHALSDEVRRFANKVLNEDTMFADELRAAACNYGAIAILDLDPRDAAEIARLKTLEPNLLERAYLRETIRWYEREKAILRREIETGKDLNLMTWAFQRLPTIEASISQGQEVERTIGMQVTLKTEAKRVL